MATDEWTVEKCLVLIERFKERPTLWDQKNPMFYKKAMKSVLWVEIGVTLNMHPDKCRHKMAILMSSFRREKAKLACALKSGKDHNSSWFAFQALSFLLDKDARKRSAMGIMYEEDNSETDDEEIPETPKTEELSIRPKKVPRIDVIPAMEQIVKTSQDNEIKCFTNFIASKMMKYSEPTKNAVQQAICEVIFKADQTSKEQTQAKICKTAKSHDISHEPGSVIMQQPSSSDSSMKVYYSDSD